MTLSALTILPMKMPATAKRRIYHEDALTDGLAEVRVDAWARRGLSLKQRQLNNFALL
jgi:alkylhydroperoxidase/carboxymuconolactone decarboxylase family protein YurZ